MLASSSTEVVAVTGFVRSTAPAVEFSLRMLVVIVPVVSAIVAPEFTVTEFVPLTVFWIVTDWLAAASAVNVMFVALTVPEAAVCKLANVAVTWRLPATVPPFSVIGPDATVAESETTAFVPAFRVNDVAVVSEMLMSPVVAVAVREPVDSDAVA